MESNVFIVSRQQRSLSVDEVVGLASGLRDTSIVGREFAVGPAPTVPNEVGPPQGLGEFPPQDPRFEVYPLESLAAAVASVGSGLAICWQGDQTNRTMAADFDFESLRFCLGLYAYPDLRLLRLEPEYGEPKIYESPTFLCFRGERPPFSMMLRGSWLEARLKALLGDFDVAESAIL